jgi:hypothetical protein
LARHSNNDNEALDMHETPILQSYRTLYRAANEDLDNLHERRDDLSRISHVSTSLPQWTSPAPPRMAPPGAAAAPPPAATPPPSGTEDIESDDSIRTKLMRKFDVLRRKYSSAAAEIPTFTAISDVKTMQTIYQRILWQLVLDYHISSYKDKLNIAFMLIQGIGMAIGLKEMDGFARDQVGRMHTYQHVLVELGEAAYIDDDKPSAYSPMLRLFGIVLMNAGIFLGGKFMMRFAGSGPACTPSPGPPGPTPSAAPPPPSTAPPRRSMRVPTVRVDDID